MSGVPGPDAYPGDAVQDQLDAYNAGDLDAFLRCYDPDAVVTDAAGVVVMQGQEQMRERYGRRLGTPGLRATVPSRLVGAGWTVDHELLTGFDGGDAEALVAYRLGPDRRIDRVVFLDRASSG